MSLESTVRRPLRFAILGALAAAGALLPALAIAQCSESPIPQLVATDSPFFANRSVSDDGRAVAFLGRSAGMPVNSRALHVFHPVSGLLRQLGSAIEPTTQTSPTGATVLNPIQAAGISADGLTAFRSYGGGLSFSFVGGQQVGFLRTRNEPSYAVDVATGIETPIPSIAQNLAQPLGVPFASRIIDISADGRYLLMAEEYGNGGTVPFQSLLYRLDRQTGATLDIPALFQSLPPFVSDGGTPAMSGDGRKIAFSGDLGNRLLTPGFDFQPTNAAEMFSEPYVLNLDTGALERAYEFDISQPRTGGSSLGFLRALGRTGSVFAFDRTGPIPGDPNPLGVVRIGYALPGSPADVDILLPARAWLRGTFGTGIGSIAESEDRIYFLSGDDLVGQNPQLSNQVYSISIPDAAITQITHFDDGIGQALSLGINFDNFVSQTVNFTGASFDNTTVTVQAFNVDNQAPSTTTTSQAGGRRTVGFSRPQPDSNRLLRVFRCSP